MPTNVELANASNASNAGMLAAVLLYTVATAAYASDFVVRRSWRSTQVRQGPLADAADARQADLLHAAGGAVSAGQAVVASAAGNGEGILGHAGGPSASVAVEERWPAAPRRPSDGDGLAGNSGGHPDPAGTLSRRWPSSTRMRIGFGLTFVGLVAETLALVMRGMVEHRVPLGNMYEFIAVCTCMAVAASLAAGLRYGGYFLGAFVLVPVLILLVLDVTLVYVPAGSVVPALNSYWIWIHVTAMTVSVGLFLVGAVATALYMIADWQQRRRVAGRPAPGSEFMAHLADPSTLDRLSYRSVLFGFPVWTFGIVAGAIWADHAWGRYWGWDPKEIWSFITWLMFAAYLHARATPGFRGAKAAFFHLAGFGCLLFNVIAVNLWISGLHSYAGLQ